MKTLMKFSLVFILLMSMNNFLQAQCSQNCESGTELVNNGDFTAGNTGFSSDLIFSTVCNYGRYGITTNASLWCGNSNWDAITANGNYLIIDGSSSTINQRVWYTTVSVNAFQDYAFSYWIHPTVNIPAYSGYNNRPIIEMVIDGNVVNTFDAHGKTVVWTEICANYTPTTSGTIEIALRQTNAGSGGWDYGIEDVSFTECVDPCKLTFDFLHQIEQCRVDFQLNIDPMYLPYVVEVEWTFGDGYSGSGLTPSHYYQDIGTFEVCAEIVVFDPVTRTCCIIKDCYLVDVHEQCKDCNLEGAHFDYRLNEKCCEYEFIGAGVPNTEIIGWSWDFGDGTSGTGQTINHTFPSAGTYTVCSTIIGRGMDGECCVIEFCEDITVKCDGGNVAMEKTKTQISKPDSKTSKSSSELSVYPNPTEGGITVEFKQEVLGQVSMYLLDMNGKEVKVLMEAEEVSKGKYSKKYNDVDLPTGIYILQMVKNGETEMSKVMVK